ncbi:MAG: hypothetical protein IJB85_03020 [Clostridia bacterium]|nr:hypothetical protein [Clostridia bacterium]
MPEKNRCLGTAAGVVLCVLVLVLSVVLQNAAYPAMLDGDIAAELMLARHQADTGSLIAADWMYSTEVRIFSPNLFYALAFAFDVSFKWARIIGNTLGLALAMAACMFMARKARLSWGISLCAGAMLAVTASPIYAYVMSEGGFYLCHCILGLLAGGLWLSAGEGGGGKRRSLLRAGAFALLCMALGFLSVRYVLCFACPMLAVAAWDMLFAPHVSHSLHDRRMRLGSVTAAGFITCAVGYAASEIMMPRLFESGVGAAGSFMFAPLDGAVLSGMLFTIAADMLKLMGWRGGVSVFSLAGVVNACVGGVLVLGAAMAARVYRSLSVKERDQRLQKRLLQLAFAALIVNLLCFLFIQGTYLNRYLVLAVLYLVPGAAVVLSREKSMRLRIVFTLLLCGQLALGGGQMLLDARRSEPSARHQDMRASVDFLLEEGYTHGYGDFWTVRVMEELSEGALTFAGVREMATEEGALSPVSLEMIRWLETKDAANMDACGGKTFLICTMEEDARLKPFIEYAKAPLICENASYRIYGFESSQAFTQAVLLSRMKLTGAEAGNGIYTLAPGGRMRVPADVREAGTYTLSFVCSGESGQDSRAAMYVTRHFAVAAEQPIVSGENALTLTLDQDDKYFMILLEAGLDDSIEISRIKFEKN